MKLAERRQHFRVGLSSLYLPFYDALGNELQQEWQPYSGFRSMEYQTTLWRKGRETEGSIVTNAKAGESPHNYGCATDWCLWDESGKPFWPDADSVLWKPYLQALEKVGLVSGSPWSDFPHNELSIQTSWRLIHLVYKQAGLRGAYEKIELEMR